MKLTLLPKIMLVLIVCLAVGVIWIYVKPKELESVNHGRDLKFERMEQTSQGMNDRFTKRSNRKSALSSQKETMYLELLTRWRTLAKENASQDLFETLADDSVKLLMFSKDMESLMDSLENENIRGKGLIKERLYKILQGTDNSDAISSMLENPAILKRFWDYYAFIEVAIRDTSEAEFVKIAGSLSVVDNDYGQKAQLYRNLHTLKINPEKLYMDSFKLLDMQGNDHFNSGYLRMLTADLPVQGGDVDFGKLVEGVATGETDERSIDARKLITDIALPSLYERWAVDDPTSALEHSVKNFSNDLYFNAVIKGATTTMTPIEVSKWLDTIEDEKISGKARSLVASRLGGEPVLSRIIAEGISDIDLRQRTLMELDRRENSDAIEFDPANR